MKIYYVGVLEKSGSTGKTVISAEDVSNFSYFYRKNVQQFLKFTSEVVVGRTNVEQRVRVQVIS